MTTSVESVRILKRVLQSPETIEVHYQPLVGFDSKNIIGAESLLRVSDAGRPVPPALLIEAATMMGAERELGRAVLNRVCGHMSTWPTHLVAAVNVAPSELNDPVFAVEVETTLDRYGIEPTSLSFEITEDWVTPDDQLVSNLEHLVGLGCEIALDDFGTGFSSLSHLRTMPLTAVKLDRTFVEYVDQPGPESEIVRSVIHMSHALGHRVCAEGVERIGQLLALDSFGCDRWQGYLCSPAVAPDEFLKVVLDPSDSFQSNPIPAHSGANRQVHESWDSFVFRRISAERWAHVGGKNRGEGWAGIVDVDEFDAPILRTALEQLVARVDGPGQQWLIGPYHPSCAVLVAADRDTIVVFGSTEVGGLPALRNGEWMTHASRLAAEIGSVSPAKLLADELEQSEALHTLMSGASTTIDTTLRHVIETIADSLSCEFGLVYLETLDVLATTTATPCAFDVDAMKADLRLLRSSLVAQQCVQSVQHRAFPVSFGGVDLDVRSWMVIPTAPVFGGVILCAHTNRNPRGFTKLCQRLGSRLADGANLLLEAAAERETLQQRAIEANVEARTDPLTGLSNRLAWDETLDGCSDGRTTAIVFDLDGLKTVNDAFGHAAGDRQIVAMARALQRAARATDTVARIGGDEFGVLLHEASGTIGLDYVDRVLLAAGVEIEFSYGVAIRLEHESVRETVHRADTAMYKNKRSRRLLNSPS